MNLIHMVDFSVILAMETFVTSCLAIQHFNHISENNQEISQSRSTNFQINRKKER